MHNFNHFIKKCRLTGPALSSTVTDILYWLGLIAYLELILSIFAFGGVDLRFGYALAFGGVFACILALAMSFLPRKGHLIATLILTLLLIIFYGSQVVYRHIFGTLYSVSLIQQGGAAIKSFWKETLHAITASWLWILALAAPMAVAPVIYRLRKSSFQASNWPCRAIVVVLAATVQLGAVFCLKLNDTGLFSDAYFYSSNITTTDQAADRFGLLTAFRLELFGGQSISSQVQKNEASYYVPTTTPTPATQPQQTQPGETVPQVTEPVIEYNVLSFDFNKLNTMTESEKIQALNRYCASIPGTRKNEYTGMLAEYNLILLCAESFATGAIHPELTPTLYKMANSGFVFENFYNTYPNTTTDGEYSLCMGLFPDSSRGKEIASLYATRNSYLPFCLGNAFQQQRGIDCYGYHNYLGSFYGRDESHPNMGYAMKFMNDGMRFTYTWPSSDLKMMEQSMADYIRADRQFHAYYMTFSGHYSYDRADNEIAAKNWDAVKHLDISEEARCYLSCNIELDKALALLMQELEAKGVADKTAIVLVGDHFPYGLEDKEYSELVGYKIDKFTKFKSSLLFWVGGMEEPVTVEEYCCNVDILPTLLNLWGFDYDSRLLAGTDIFSDGQHIAILDDMSFYTDKVWLNASSGEIRYLADKDTLPEGYVENMVRLVQTKYQISADILNTSYYNFLFDKGEVEMGRDHWRDPVVKDPEPEPEPTEPPEETTAPSEPGGETTPEETVPEETEPEASKPETTEPEKTEPETTEPEKTEPETTDPPKTEPEATDPPAPQPPDPT